MLLYPTAIYQKKDHYIAHLPDIPDMELKGNSMADTIAAAREAVFKHLSDLTENEQPLPLASEINTHLLDPKYAGWTWAIVNIDSKRMRCEEVEVSFNLSQRLLQRIQAQLDGGNQSLQEFFVESIKNNLT